jgi:hypothetical protein
MNHFTRIFSVALLFTLLTGCSVAVPYAIHVYKVRDFIKLEIVADGQAVDVYDMLNRFSKERNPDRVVENDDREKLEYEGYYTKPGGRIFTVMWKAKRLNPTQVCVDFTIKADDDGEPSNEQELEEIVFESLGAFCKNIRRTCAVSLA